MNIRQDMQQHRQTADKRANNNSEKCIASTGLHYWHTNFKCWSACCYALCLAYVRFQYHSETKFISVSTAYSTRRSCCSCRASFPSARCALFVLSFIPHSRRSRLFCVLIEKSVAFYSVVCEYDCFFCYWVSFLFILLFPAFNVHMLYFPDNMSCTLCLCLYALHIASFHWMISIFTRLQRQSRSLTRYASQIIELVEISVTWYSQIKPNTFKCMRHTTAAY